VEGHEVQVLNEGPVFEGKGRERFRGCLNRDHNQSCHGDPKGS
jgi:hypothetical protein